MRGFVPTTSQNVSARLFWRYTAIYIAAATVGVLSSIRGVTLPFLGQVGAVGLWLTGLSALAALLVVSNFYLLALSAFKGFFDAQLIHRLVLLVRADQVGFVCFNACFLLVAASVLLFLPMGALAARFSYENHGRDFELVFSKPFLRYLLRALLLIFLAVAISFLWSRLLGSLPML